MDLLTQAALGATVGELTLGKEAGNRAALWGAIGGLLPEVDRLLPWLYNDYMYVVYRQSLTHSLLFVILGSVLSALAIYRGYKKEVASFRGWWRLWFWVLATHVALDCCHTWGVQLFFPIWSHRVAGNFIAEIDPLFSLPLLLGLFIGLRHARDSRPRNFWIGLGIVLSGFYLLATITNKQFVKAVFRYAVEQQAQEIQRLEVYPTLGNNLLWYGIAEVAYGYHVGYFSPLTGPDGKVSLHYTPKYHGVPEEIADISTVQVLRQATNRYYVVESEGNTLLWHDLRYGLGSVWPDSTVPPAKHYSFVLQKSPVVGKPAFTLRRSGLNLSSSTVGVLWHGIWGINLP